MSGTRLHLARLGVPAVPLFVLLSILLLLDDPEKPWSGIAYASAVVTVVAIGWAVRHWLIVLIPWVAFGIAMVVAQDDEAEPDCYEFCITDGAAFAALFFVLAILVSIGTTIRWIVRHLRRKRRGREDATC